MIGEGDCGAIGGMKMGKGNRSTRRKPAPASFCPPQIPLYQTRVRTLAAAVSVLFDFWPNFVQLLLSFPNLFLYCYTS
jgi:hypothetical protein